MTPSCSHRLLFFILLYCNINAGWADTIGIHAGAGSWNHQSSGQITHQGTNADMEKEFGFKDELTGFFFIGIEHPLPFIPNIKLSSYPVETIANRTVTASTEFSFAGASYTNGTDIKTTLLWDEQDVLVYYEIVDNIFSLDLGLGAKAIDAKLSVTASGSTHSLRMEETLPIGYAMGSVMLPGTGLSFIIEHTSSVLGDIKVKQTNSKLSYMLGYKLGIEAGYRTSNANLDELTGVTGELTFSGPFINLAVNF